jgi:hypothetical protein
MSFVIVQRMQQGKKENIMWLAATVPQQWAALERAMRFETRREARRVADSIKVSGDWSIQMAPPTMASPLTLDPS